MRYCVHSLFPVPDASETELKRRLQLQPQKFIHYSVPQKFAPPVIDDSKLNKSGIWL